MQHSRRSTELGFRHLSKQVLTASSTSTSVVKYRLCVASRRVSFQTRSIGASCGLYGGRNSRDKMPRCLRKNGASSTAWWYLALSNTITMRLPRERWRKLAVELRATPREFGLEASLWDGPLLSEHLRRRYGIELGVRQCQRLFRQMGFRLRKPRPQVAQSDPIKVATVKKTAPAGKARGG